MPKTFVAAPQPCAFVPFIGGPIRTCDKIDGRMYGRNPCATIVRNDDTKEMMPVPRADEMANQNRNTNRNSQSGPTNKPRKMTWR